MLEPINLSIVFSLGFLLAACGDAANGGAPIGAGGAATTASSAATGASAGPTSSTAATTSSTGAGAGGAGGGGAGPHDLGMVTSAVAAPCNNKLGPLLPGSKCQEITVDCAGLETIGATVAISEPAQAIGTIIVHDGGGGETFFGRIPTVQGYFDAGYRIVEIAWASDWEQSAMSPGIKGAACRPSTVLKWVFDGVHGAARDKAFCGQGQSGGAAVMSYALSAYGLGDLLDYVMITSGPPFGRMDCGCGSQAADCSPPANYCPELSVAALEGGIALPEKVAMWEGLPTCGPNASPSDLAKYAADSVVSAGSTFEYPKTRMSGWHCAMMPNGTAAGGDFFLSSVTTEGGSKPGVFCSPTCSVESIYDKNATLTDQTFVSDDMLAEMKSGCVPRHD